MNPFKLFDLQETFRINLEELDKAYLSSQSLYHPDKHVRSLPQEQAFAREKSIQLNQAYGILKNPLSRARALLECKHIPVPGENGTTIQSPELLMEIMTLREELSTCQTPETHQAFIENLEKAYQKACEDFEQKTEGPEYIRLAYLDKLMTEARAQFHADSAD